MAMTYGGVFTNAQLTQLNTLATNGVLRIYTGAAPTHAQDTEPTVLIATVTLPATPFTVTTGTSLVASVASINSGPWTGAGVAPGGTAASWRIYQTGGTVPLIQGNMTDLVLNNNSIATGQTVTISSFSITGGNW